MELIKHGNVLSLSMYLLKRFGRAIPHAEDTPRYDLVHGDVTIHSVNGDDLMRIDDTKLIVLMTESKYLLNRDGVLHAIKMFEEDRNMVDDLSVMHSKGGGGTVSLKIVVDGTDLRFEHELVIEVK